MPANPKSSFVKDRKYLDWLRTQSCLLTGASATQDMAIDPMHVGTAGKGLKADDEAIPVIHSLHQQGHSTGEISMLRANAPDWLLREAFRAYARQMYRAWKSC